jgi:superfamily II DNA or RNA helicase
MSSAITSVSGKWENYFNPNKKVEIESDFKTFRVWQNEAYGKYDSTRNLILNAPTASGKTLFLLSLIHKQLSENKKYKAVISVPQTMIGYGFEEGMFTLPSGENVTVHCPDINNICNTVENEKAKVKRLKRFLKSKIENVSIDCRIAIVCHQTLIKSYDKQLFKNIFMIIDEAHHISSGDSVDQNSENKLGAIVRKCLKETPIRIALSTATFMRADLRQILSDEDKIKFDTYKVTFDEFIKDCKYLRGFNYKFLPYEKEPDESLYELFKTVEKTIVFIPSVCGKSDSQKIKTENVYKVLFAISQVKDKISIKQYQKNYIKDIDAPVLEVKRGNDWVKVVNLVNEHKRNHKKEHIDLAHKTDIDAIDVIIALDMMKEGANWQWATREIIMGNRGSFPELMQMIGRVLRDAPNKNIVEVYHVMQTYTPDEKTKEKNKEKINDITKAVFVSLLLEDILCFKLPRMNKKADDYKRLHDFFETGEDYSNCLNYLVQKCSAIEACNNLSAEEKEEYKKEEYAEMAEKYHIEDADAIRKCIERKIKGTKNNIKLAKSLDKNYLKGIDIDLVYEESPYLAMQYCFTTRECKYEKFVDFKNRFKNNALEDEGEFNKSVNEIKEQQIISGNIKS